MDPLQSPQPGGVSPFLTSFSTVNTSLEMLRNLRRTHRGQPGTTKGIDFLGPTCRVYIKNNTGGTLLPHSVVRIGDPVISAVDYPYQVAATPTFNGESPTAANNAFAILEEGISASDVNRLARAVVLGVIPCYVNVTDTDHEFAVPASGVTASLASATNGPARILWKDSGTGTVRAIVSVNPVPERFAAELTSSYDASTGYNWKRRALNVPSFGDASPSQTGQYAFEIGGNQSLVSGAQVLLWRAGNGYEFFHPDLSDLTGTISGGVSWVKVTKTYSDLAAASTSNDIQVYSLATKGTIHGVVIKHNTEFAGGGITSYILSVGVSGSAEKYTSTKSVTTAPSDIDFRANRGTLSADNPQPEDFGSATSIRLFATSGGANLDAATQGTADIYLCVGQLP